MSLLSDVDLIKFGNKLPNELVEHFEVQTPRQSTAEIWGFARHFHEGDIAILKLEAPVLTHPLHTSNFRTESVYLQSGVEYKVSLSRRSENNTKQSKTEIPRNSPETGHVQESLSFVVANLYFSYTVICMRYSCTLKPIVCKRRIKQCNDLFHLHGIDKDV